WGREGAEFLGTFLERHGPGFEADMEFTVEVNPGSHGPGVLEAFRSVGVNRFSVGLQTLDPRLLKLLDRVHTSQESLGTLEELATWGGNYSVDFMLGLPDS